MSDDLDDFDVPDSVPEWFATYTHHGGAWLQRSMSGDVGVWLADGATVGDVLAVVRDVVWDDEDHADVVAVISDSVGIREWWEDVSVLRHLPHDEPVARDSMERARERQVMGWEADRLVHDLRALDWEALPHAVRSPYPPGSRPLEWQPPKAA